MRVRLIAAALALLIGLGLAGSPTATVAGAAEKDQESAAAAKVTVDASLPEYKATGGVSGDLKFIGSDTMVNLAQLWGEGFRQFYPSLQVSVEAKGSVTA